MQFCEPHKTYQFYGVRLIGFKYKTKNYSNMQIVVGWRISRICHNTIIILSHNHNPQIHSLYKNLLLHVASNSLNEFLLLHKLHTTSQHLHYIFNTLLFNFTHLFCYYFKFVSLNFSYFNIVLNRTTVLSLHSSCTVVGAIEVTDDNDDIWHCL